MLAGRHTMEEQALRIGGKVPVKLPTSSEAIVVFPSELPHINQLLLVAASSARDFWATVQADDVHWACAPRRVHKWSRWKTPWTTSNSADF
mmetsp:Transcript_21722/g.57608  ORF Transcript_21722/g.57608 Transcript_21722/m.57608 type:complete len:91 (+) Transcript_21722:231-503(+)